METLAMTADLDWPDGPFLDLLGLVANALVNKGVALAVLGRSEDAIAACDGCAT